MATYTWTNHEGERYELEDVSMLIFEATHVTFYDAKSRLLLAEPADRVVGLSERREGSPDALGTVQALEALADELAQMPSKASSADEMAHELETGMPGIAQRIRTIVAEHQRRTQEER